MQDLIAYQRDVWSRNDVAGYDELLDATQVQEAVGFTGTHLQEIARVASSMDVPNKSTKFAIVASDNFYFGLGRMYEVYRGLQGGNIKEVSVFRSVKDALAWIQGAEAKNGESKNT